MNAGPWPNPRSKLFGDLKMINVGTVVPVIVAHALERTANKMSTTRPELVMRFIAEGLLQHADDVDAQLNAALQVMIKR